MHNTRIALILLFCLLCIPSFAGKKDRGIASMKSDSVYFARKGSFIIGGSATWTKYRGNDFEVAVIKDVNLDGYALNVKPTFMYCIKNDLAIGVCGVYKRTKVDIPSAELDIESLSMGMEDYFSISHKYGAGVFLRKYVPLGRTGRFSLYVDAVAEYTGGQAKLTNWRKDQTVGTYQTSNAVGIGVNPGLSAFITEHFIIGAGLGIFGVDFNWVDQTHNQVDTGSRNGFSASFNLNLLSLSISAYYCF